LETGAYTIVVEGDNLTDTGDYRLTYQQLDVIVGFPDEAAVPGAPRLRAIPNPFTGVATLAVSLPEDLPVSVRVFGPRGGLVRSWTHDRLPAGSHRILWDGRDERGNPASSGLYYVEIRVGESILRQKLVNVK
jgi:hypothetical protein